jgi:uncharacterized protein
MMSRHTWYPAGEAMVHQPIRLRDFVEDQDGWLYAVSTYDNTDRVGCLLRYVPDPVGPRQHPSGTRYRKFDFEEAYAWIRCHKPQYDDIIHRVPLSDVKRVLRPDAEFARIEARDRRVKELARLLALPQGSIGCTGSLLLGLEAETSDIDLVVYGPAWFLGQQRLKQAIKAGIIEDLSLDMWRTVYAKRQPEIPFDQFMAHELRKWNRGVFGGTYFDLLYTRANEDLGCVPTRRGEVLGRRTIEATVTDASLAFDSPAVYEVEHDEITRVLSFTHTYSGQALSGEVIEACGVCERHGDECWLVVGTTRSARGEYIISRTLLDEQG